MDWGRTGEKAIIWTYNGLVWWRIGVSRGHSELMGDFVFNSIDHGN